MDDLIGHQINQLFISDDNELIVFNTTSGKKIAYSTQNDCCNTVWFNHITGVKTVLGEGNLFELMQGATVLDVEQKDWTPSTTELEGTDVCEEGFWTIKTDKGYLDIEVRNDSNGYYGGRVEFEYDFNWDDNKARLKLLTGDI